MTEQYQQVFSIAQNLIDAALTDLGILNPTSTQKMRGLTALNSLLDSWSVDRLMVYVLERVSYGIVSQTNAYSIGPTQGLSHHFSSQFTPIKIEYSFLTDSSGYDHPIEIASIGKYNRCEDKTGTGMPTLLSYLRTTPNYGTIYLYPIPDSASYIITFGFWRQFKQFSSISDSLTFAPGYANALQLNLAVALATIHSIPLDTVYLQRAINAKMRLGNINSDDVDEMEFDSAITYALR